MCGIAAIYNYRSSKSVDQAELSALRDRMSCRGPDGVGAWCSDDGRVALAHLRLAIIDLSERGAQPMASDIAAGAHMITFNGEIYNYKELRARLEAQGHHFRSDSDTEVLLKLYAEKGDEMVHDLGGMFAFALWDGIKGRLLLARDPFGIKPLYFADDGSCIRIASEVRSLVATGTVDISAEPAGHVGFFLLGSVPEPYTLYKGVRALPAGSTMWVSPRGVTAPKRYADVTRMLGANERSVHISVKDAESELRLAVEDTVRRHLVADVDVGVFLSAGLDSATLVAVASELGGSLRTVTLGFDEFRGSAADETTLADAVARQYRTNHRTVWVGRDDFAAAREVLLSRMDQPSIDGVNTYFVARAAASTGLKVALSGLGGDELFGGYSSFRDIPRLVGALSRIPGVATIGRGLRVLSAPVMARVTSPKYAGVLEYGSDWAGAYLLRRGLYMPWELSSVLDADLVRSGLRDLCIEERLAATVVGIDGGRRKVSALESTWYMRNQLLRDTDWASMSSSLEVRVPFVDWRFWARVTPLIRATKGALNKSALAGVSRRPLPPALLARPKTGFSIPVREWLLHDANGDYRGRGLRAWARYVYDRVARVN